MPATWGVPPTEERKGAGRLGLGSEWGPEAGCAQIKGGCRGLGLDPLGSHPMSVPLAWPSQLSAHCTSMARL